MRYRTASQTPVTCWSSLESSGEFFVCFCVCLYSMKLQGSHFVVSVLDFMSVWKCLCYKGNYSSKYVGSTEPFLTI